MIQQAKLSFFVDNLAMHRVNNAKDMFLLPYFCFSLLFCRRSFLMSTSWLTSALSFLTLLSAMFAAFWWLSFLENPFPSPSLTPSTITAALKVGIPLLTFYSVMTNWKSNWYLWHHSISRLLKFCSLSAICSRLMCSLSILLVTNDLQSSYPLSR